MAEQILESGWGCIKKSSLPLYQQCGLKMLLADIGGWWRNTEIDNWRQRQRGRERQCRFWENIYVMPLSYEYSWGGGKREKEAYTMPFIWWTHWSNTGLCTGYTGIIKRRKTEEREGETRSWMCPFLILIYVYGFGERCFPSFSYLVKCWQQ